MLENLVVLKLWTKFWFFDIVHLLLLCILWFLRLQGTRLKVVVIPCQNIVFWDYLEPKYDISTCPHFLLYASHCTSKKFEFYFGKKRCNLQDKGKSWKLARVAHFFAKPHTKIRFLGVSSFLVPFYVSPQRLVYFTFCANILPLDSDVFPLRYLKRDAEAWRKSNSSHLHQPRVFWTVWQVWFFLWVVLCMAP